MAQKKSTPASRAKSRVASRAAGAARASATRTSTKQERAAVSRSVAKPRKVTEAGVGWGNVVKAGMEIAKKIKLTPGTSATLNKSGSYTASKSIPKKSPLGKGAGKQNVAAQTYKTSNPRSASQIAADQRAKARMKKTMSKARTYNKSVGAAAVGAGAVGFIAGQETQERANRKKTSSRTKKPRSN